MLETILDVRGVRKRFGGQEVLKGIDLSVRQGEFFSLLGASGCGKTTLLRIIAGFEQASSGAIVLAGKDATNTPVQGRNLNLVFQNYALFPHMSVQENIAFGLRLLRSPKMSQSEIAARVNEMLALVRLEGLEKRLPMQLSGGQQQRVALARALAPHPALLLLDEPMGALDAGLRQEMQRELRALQRRLGLTFIHVTHDQDEALAMSDRIAILHAGELLQVGTPEEVYATPASRAVADFFPEASFFAATCSGGKMASCAEIAGVLELAESFPAGTRVDIHARPERLTLAGVRPESPTAMPARVRELSYLGREVRYIVELASGRTVVVSQGARTRFEPGDAVEVGFATGPLHALAAPLNRASAHP